MSKFIGSQLGAVHIQWENNIIEISWSEGQKDLLDEEGSYNLSPEFIRSIIDTIESNHAEIRDLKAQLANKSLEVDQLKKIQGEHIFPLSWTDQDKKSFENQILKLQDYFLRAQQLITILSGLDKRRDL